MNLKMRTSLTIGLPVVVLIIGVYMALLLILADSSRQLDSRFANNAAQRVASLIVEDLKSRSRSTQSLSDWDLIWMINASENPEATAKAMIPSGEFESIGATVFSVENFQQYELDLAAIIHQDGHIVSSRAYDASTGSIVPFPEGLVPHLEPRSATVSFAGPGREINGLLSIPEGLVLFLSRPVVKSDGSGPAHGSVIVGRFLNDAALEDLRELAAVDVSFLARALSVPKTDAMIPDGPDFSTSIAKDTDDGQLVGEVLVSDVYGVPVVTMYVSPSHAIHQESISWLQLFLIVFVVTGLLIGAFAVFTTDHLVLRPLARFSRRMSRFGDLKNLGSRMPVQGTDEFAELAITTNTIMNRLEQTDRELKERTTFRDVVTDAFVRLNRILPDQLDRTIRDTLESMCKSVNVDRAYVYVSHDAGDTVELAYTWTNPHAILAGDPFHAGRSYDHAWWVDQLTRVGYVRVNRVSEMPEAASKQQQILVKIGILSTLAVPLLHEDGRLAGFLGLSNIQEERQWSQENIALLRSIGDLINGAMHQGTWDHIPKTTQLFTSQPEPQAFKPETTDTPVLNTEVLMEAVVGDIEVFRQLLSGFSGNTPTLIERLHTAFNDGDTDLLRREAHTLKGGAGSFGAMRLYRLAEQIEEAVLASDLDHAAELLATVEPEWDALKKEIDQALAIEA
jgi:sensor domain CHASE-containing protein/HPt (histidine-containing phosphotransfer) domain-containing protein